MGTLSATGLVFILGFLVSDPHEEFISQHVDLVEVNHFCDEAGKPKFDQYIFYNWSNERARFDVIDYKQKICPSQEPKYINKQKGYVMIWHDKTDHRILRRVHAKNMIETWTKYDPEMVERKFLPKDMRIELYRIVDMRSNLTKKR